MTNNKIYFIANWKMYGTLNSVQSLKNVIKLKNKQIYNKVKIIYCPPYTLLESFSKSIKKTKLELGAQNCHFYSEYGAFTGSVNSKMIKNVGCKYVILGHSENRISGDSDKIINLKVKSSIKENLKIIFCIGETLKEKKKNKTNLILKKQLINGLRNIKNKKNIIFAYEPVWSIGTGIIPKSKNLENLILQIKHFLKHKFRIKDPTVLYGGSVNPKNISTLKQISSINGFLIGGASQNSKKFIDIIKKTIN